MVAYRDRGPLPAVVATLLVALWVTVPAGVGSTVLLKVDLERMSQESTMVVKGYVVWDFAVRPAPTAPIYSYTGVEITECVTGDCPEGVVLKHRGGTVGELTMHIPGMPSFQPGQEVLLFLRPEPEGEKDAWSVFAMAQGHFLIHEDPETGVQTAVQQLGKVNLAQKLANGSIVPDTKTGPIVRELGSLIAEIRELAGKEKGGGE